MASLPVLSRKLHLGNFFSHLAVALGGFALFFKAEQLLPDLISKSRLSSTYPPAVCADEAVANDQHLASLCAEASV